jgi:hypothetical protein
LRGKEIVFPFGLFTGARGFLEFVSDRETRKTMPLMTKLPDAMDHAAGQLHLEAENQKLEFISEKKERDEKDSGYEDFDVLDEEENSDMEGSILHRPRPIKAGKPPAVPQRSDKRASKSFDSVVLELQSLDGTVAAKDAEQLSVVSDPHELYLSSEEDASLSDDYDDSDSLVDFAPTEEGESNPSSRASSRRSQEDIARVVSFTIVTKPRIIQIRIPSTATQKRHSVTLDTLKSSMTNSSRSTSYIPTRRPPPLKLYPSSSNHRLSISSSSSTPLTHHSNTSNMSLPVQKSRKLNLSNIVSNAKDSFLSSDPFGSTPNPNDRQRQEKEEQERPMTPKTPTSMAAAAWKKSLSRSLSKRRPSMPKLSLAYTAGVVSNQRDSLRLARELAAEASRETKERMMVQRAETMPVQSDGVRYKDIITAAGEVMKAPPVPSDGRERKMSMGHKMSLSMGLVRKRSIKGKADH